MSYFDENKKKTDVKFLHQPDGSAKDGGIVSFYNYKITKEGEWFVSEDLKTGIASQGSNYSEAVNNLKEALELYNQK